MWRRLNEEEKRNLMINYKFGAYLLRFLMGMWILFITLYYVNGVKATLISFSEGNYFSGIGVIVGALISAIFFYGIPLFLIVNIGTEEIRTLKNDNVFIGEAIFVSAGYTHRNKGYGSSGRNYYAIVKIIDEWGNAYTQTTCRSIGNLKSNCREGDRITVLKVAKSSGEEIICMRKKLL